MGTQFLLLLLLDSFVQGGGRKASLTRRIALDLPIGMQDDLSVEHVAQFTNLWELISPLQMDILLLRVLSPGSSPLMDDIRPSQLTTCNSWVILIIPCHPWFGGFGLLQNASYLLG
jgi:hypothetical protein